MDSSSSAPPRLRVGVIGAGRVGTVLAAALARAGHPVLAGYALSDSSRRHAAALIPQVPLLAEIDAVVTEADLVLLTVPDDVLSGLVLGLAQRGVVRKGSFVVHTAGAQGVAVLEPLTRLGALPLAIHPAMTFAGTTVDLQRLAGCSFGVTAPEPLLPVAQALVVEMGGEPVVIAEEMRTIYHAALASGANHLVTIVATAMDLLGRAGVEKPAHMLAPLLGAALDNTLRKGDAALTGPVARGDAGTVASHLAVLAAVAPETLPSYVALARLTADRAMASGRLDAAAAADLLDVLSDQART
ncbi:MAG: hypothetical protein QOJ92_1385 [Frankiales bacterium]|nr:hypothetical protein [Frankiales bacterium]